MYSTASDHPCSLGRDPCLLQETTIRKRCGIMLHISCVSCNGGVLPDLQSLQRQPHNLRPDICSYKYTGCFCDPLLVLIVQPQLYHPCRCVEAQSGQLVCVCANRQKARVCVCKAVENIGDPHRRHTARDMPSISPNAKIGARLRNTEYSCTVSEPRCLPSARSANPCNRELYGLPADVYYIVECIYICIYL